MRGELGPDSKRVREDETLVRLLTHDLLTDAGYAVLEARDGEEALTILHAHDGIIALFTDVRMPKLDGLSLARIVSESWPTIGIVITSAEGIPPTVPERARFLQKPY